MKSSNKAALLFLALGLPFFIFGMKEFFQVTSFVAAAEQADGIIIEMKEKPNKYYPLVRFQTASGETFEFTSGNGTNPPMYEVNEHVPVLYNCADPSYAVINSFIEIWLGPTIYTALGLLLLVYNGFAWVKARSYEKN